MLEQSMVRTQIYLTQEQQRSLERLAAATGRRKSDLIRAALDEVPCAASSEELEGSVASLLRYVGGPG